MTRVQALKDRIRILCLALAGLMGMGGGSLATDEAIEAGIFHGEATLPQEPKLSLEGGIAWINTAGPIHLEDLKGKIVLLDFWTYCCINCHHVLPDLAKLEEKYQNELVVIGVHTAKFDAEKDTANIRKKVKEYRIQHPVVNDANQVIWRTFGVTSWPTLVLIDANGNYRGHASGEGNYAVLDKAISDLITIHESKKELNLTPLTFKPEKDQPHNSPLLFPGKILADAKGKRLFISDTGHNRIVVTSLKGEVIDVIGSGQEGFSDGAYQTSTFNRQQGMCLVNGILYVADTENHAIRAIDLSAKRVLTAAGTGKQSQRREGGGPGKTTGLNSPWDLMLLPGTKSLAVAMAGPHQLWKYDLETGEIVVWAGSGREDIIDGTPTTAAFAQPSGLATDGKHLFVADSEVSGVRSVSLAAGNRVETIVGMGLFEFNDIDGKGPAVRLQHCLGLAFGEDNLYIADSYNNKIKICTPETREVKTFLGTREAGSRDDPAQFDEPGGLSIANGKLYVADTNNHAIRIVDLESKGVTTLNLASLSSPSRVVQPPSFRNATVVEAPAGVLAPGNTLAFDVALTIPQGFKMSPDFPVRYLVSTPDKEGLLSTELSPGGEQIPKATDVLAIRVPLARAVVDKQAFTITIGVEYVVCKSGNNGVCVPKSVIFKIPVTIGDGGRDRLAVSSPK